VLLVDLDPQAFATKVLALDVGDRPTLADVLLGADWFGCSDGWRPTGAVD
jgi:hypothetical protein